MSRGGGVGSAPTSGAAFPYSIPPSVGFAEAFLHDQAGGIPLMPATDFHHREILNFYQVLFKDLFKYDFTLLCLSCGHRHNWLSNLKPTSRSLAHVQICPDAQSFLYSLAFYLQLICLGFCVYAVTEIACHCSFLCRPLSVLISGLCCPHPKS